ncbi:hypothetical protein Tco_1524691 [Tanacetum coccineum]
MLDVTLQSGFFETSKGPSDTYDSPNVTMAGSTQVSKATKVPSTPFPKSARPECITESDTDEEDIESSNGPLFGGGNQLEDEDFDFYDGYEAQVFDLPGQLKELCDFRGPLEQNGSKDKKDERVTQKDDGIFISQDNYVDEILKKFGFSTVKRESTPMETSKPLLKDAEVEDVDVHLYRLMIGSLMYLSASRPDIIYLKGQLKLSLWYPKDSPFNLEAYTDSDYAGASLDRKSTTGGCQFLRSRLISWQCKKQTIVANSTTEAEYVALLMQSWV